MTFFTSWMFLVSLSTTTLVGPDSIFELFKSFQGEWSIKSGATVLPIKMNYELGSKGSIVTEQFGKELSVFYLEEGTLSMTHYCNAGNQPHLQLSPASTKDTIEFDAVDVENVKTHPAHVQRAIYRVVSPRRIDLELVWIGSGSDESERYTLEKTGR